MGAVPAVAPRRLVVMFTHYGCMTTRFFPARSHGALTARELEPTTLKHLAPYVAKLLLPRGIRAMNEWTTSMTRGQGNDTYTQVLGSYFTCQPVTPNSDDPFSFAEDPKFNAKPLGASLDHVIAAQLSPGGKPLFVRLANRTATPFTAISYSAPETLYQGAGTAREVFSGLTGLFRPGPMNPDTYRVARGRSVLDVVRDDLSTLERFDMSRSDRMKLAAWKELLGSTGGTITAQCNSAVAASFGATQENVDAAAVNPTDGDPLTQKITATLDAADIYSSVAALAVVCNANPVVFLQYPPMYIYSGLGITMESAGLARRTGSGATTGRCVTDAHDLIATIDDYHARKFAYLVGLLDGVEEGDGKVLDNTAAVWFQEVSDGLARNLNNLPIVQVGSAGGYFKTGCAVNVDDGASDLTAGNSDSACESSYVSFDQSSGTDASLANAPINKYYCNLMNALGVRAGADGSPAIGGTAEVTRFGRYDRTEDFIGGGTKPALISDPGGFDALKA